MKVKWGAMVVAGRGKLGGHVASRNRHGSYFRTKVTPTNPSSSDQQTVRNNFTSNAQAWKGLTAAQRAQWNAAVSNFAGTDIFGDLQILSGFQLYCRINNYLDFCGQANITTPPEPASVPAFTSLTAAISNGGGTVTLTFAPAIGATESVILTSTAGLSAGKNFVKSELRKIDILDNTAASPYDCATEYIAKFGAIPAIGTKVFFTMQNIVNASGLPGAIIKASAVVAA